MFITRERNIFNTFTHEFNCMGFAFGVPEWLVIHSYVYYDNRDEIREYTDKAIQEIIKMFGKNRCRVIKEETEKTNNEFIVYFRLSDDGDFHFLKKLHNGEIYHKAGATKIRKFNKDPYCDEWSDQHNYCGPIVTFAVDNMYYR